jgi:hypothetical protein
MLDHILTRSESGHEYYAAGVALSGAAMNLNRLWDRARLPLSTWVWLAAVPIVCAAATRRIRSLSATLGAIYCLAFIVYHGDTGDLERHMVLVSSLYPHGAGSGAGLPARQATGSLRMSATPPRRPK